LVRHSLDSLSGLIAEATRVYRQARDKKLDHGEARSLVWMLSQMRAMVETQALERLEQRIEELAPSIEGKTNGYQSANRPTRTAH
jgi:predicted exporter